MNQVLHKLHNIVTHTFSFAQMPFYSRLGKSSTKVNVISKKVIYKIPEYMPIFDISVKSYMAIT